MKTYSGYRAQPLGMCQVFVDTDGVEKLLPLRLDLQTHSPSGFEWGYGGSGPAQLALALLADATGDSQLALQYYQMYKADVVAKLPSTNWTIKSAEIHTWLETHES